MSFCSYVADNDLDLNFAIAGAAIGIALMGVHFYYTRTIEVFHMDNNQKEIAELSLRESLDIHVPMAFFVGSLGAFAGAASGAALEIAGSFLCSDE
jgi:hypothetical protein